MNSMESRVLQLEAQMNAMAQAWLYLAATVEMECGVDLVSMEESLRNKRWPSAPGINAMARDTLRWLCTQLDGARASRGDVARELARIRQKPRL